MYSDRSHYPVNLSVWIELLLILRDTSVADYHQLSVQVSARQPCVIKDNTTLSKFTHYMEVY